MIELLRIKNNNTTLSHIIILSHGTEGGIIGSTTDSIGIYTDKSMEFFGWQEQLKVLKTIPIPKYSTYGNTLFEQYIKESGVLLIKSKGAITIKQLSDAIKTVVTNTNPLIIIGGCNTGITTDVVNHRLSDSYEVDQYGVNYYRFEVGGFAGKLAIELQLPLIGSAYTLRSDGKETTGLTSGYPEKQLSVKRASSVNAWKKFMPDGSIIDLNTQGFVLNLTTGIVQ